MLASIIIPTFNRSHLLTIGLSSPRAQVCDLPHEIVVVNDGPEDDTAAICDRYGCHFHWTGKRNEGGLKPRTPGIAINYGVRHAKGEIIVLTCPEVWHVGTRVLNATVRPLLRKKRALVSPTVIDDVDGTLLHFVERHEFDRNFAMKWWESKCDNQPFLANKFMPYFMAMHKKEFEAIGGYDESFCDGLACDDNDFVDRLLANGCEYHFLDNAEMVHLYHGPKTVDVNDPRYLQNVRLWKERAGVLVRNTDKDWGMG